MACVLFAVLGLVAACTNYPPPPLVSAPPKQHSAAKPTDLDQVVFGVDRFGKGFNPHRIADQSTLTTALATGMLPSVFRPAADGSPQLDRTVMESAEVTSADPFTVSYTIRTDAAWSDGVPVRAEDFLYLRDQMVSQPGVVNPEGYRLITDIGTEDGGRVVRVRFAKPYPGWRSLFDNLLPGHILKDAPGGWDSALSDGYPASAGPYMLGSLDRGRGEIMLDRNDRYWARPSGIGHIMIRRSGIEDAVSALRTDDSQLAAVSSDSGTAKALAGLGSTARTVALPRDAVAQVDLRPVGPLSDERVRTAVAAALDRTELIKAGGGDRSARADALTLAPSQPGYTPTMPEDAPGARPEHSTVRSKLSSAGYRERSGTWSLPTITVVAAAGTEPYLSIAKEAVSELEKAGIPAKLSTPSAEQLYGSLQAADEKDQAQLLVAPRTTGDDPASALASWYGCPGNQPGTNTPYPDNPGQVCLRDLQPRIDKVVRGDELLAGALPGIEKGIWQRALAIPLFQVTDLLAIRSGIENVGTDPAAVAPFPSAPEWKRTRR
ncbi:ABC transporter family substrate-binding protein [Sciscionella sediminilitoris]|uniref:ABC transporter family substrate-binding protein n=1 Tax=Sciscionella sediminilitoris TaxID=1445613 RepID=UPI00068A359A|nr:ABC transporter family substrate-binding protein [Sciscionella sp. SE31]